MTTLNLLPAVKVPAIVTLAAFSGALVFLALRLTSGSNKARAMREFIPSPRETLIPHLTSQQASALPYPPDMFPGGRDVDTPYGTMRVYEWGPDDGRKVILIHGDTTPGPMFAPIAKALVGNGCRVMIFDLWGRGYSDTPLGVPHDARQFGNQILFAAAASPISWTGIQSGGFSIIGFSLGGGIAMSFAAYYPHLVNSIVLLAPGGILRYLPIEYETRFFRYSRLVPSAYMRKLVGNILGVNLSTNGSKKSTPIELKGNPLPDIQAIVQWQFDHHQGFVHSFVNTITHGPLMDHHSDWSKVCNIISGKTSGIGPSGQPSKLYNSKLLVILGDSDGIVVEKDIVADLCDVFGGSDHIEYHVVAGGHGFPVPSSKAVIGYICNFWNLSAKPLQ